MQEHCAVLTDSHAQAIDAFNEEPTEAQLMKVGPVIYALSATIAHSM